MDIAPYSGAIEAVANLGQRLLNAFFVDRNAIERAQAEFMLEQMRNEFQAQALQLQVNAAEAENPSLFVSGWRPAVGWICVLGLGYEYLLLPVGNAVCMLLEFPTAFPRLDTEDLYPLLLGLLGLSTSRTIERLNGVHRR